MSVETAPLQGITLYSHADDFRSHWIRYVLAEKQIKYHLIMVDEDDEDDRSETRQPPASLTTITRSTRPLLHIPITS